MRLDISTWRSLQRWLVEAVTKNIWLKLFSFACAFTIYALVHGAQDAQRTFAVDLVLLSPPTDAARMLMEDPPTSVRVTLRGPRSFLDGLRREDLGNFSVDMRSMRSGWMPLDATMLHVPPGTAVQTVDPPAINLIWDDVEEKDVPVRVAVTGEVPDGLRIKGIPEITPSAVHVRGPFRVVNSIQSVRAEPLDVSGMREGVHPRTELLDQPPPRVVYNVQNVNVAVEVIKELLERTFVRVAVVVAGVAHASTAPAYVDVRVLGPPDTVKLLRPDQVVPRVDLKAAGVDTSAPGSQAMPLAFEIDGCKAVIVPSSVVVRW